MHQKKAPGQIFFLMHVFPQNFNEINLLTRGLDMVPTKCHAYIVHGSTRLTFSRFRSKIVLYFRVPMFILYIFNVKSVLAYDLLIVCFKTSRRLRESANQIVR
jgi:hypothetical protein